MMMRYSEPVMDAYSKWVNAKTEEERKKYGRLYDELAREERKRIIAENPMLKILFNED